MKLGYVLCTVSMTPSDVMKRGYASRHLYKPDYNARQSQKKQRSRRRQRSDGRSFEETGMLTSRCVPNVDLTIVVSLILVYRRRVPARV